ncbi:MAG TPA: MarR family transcriptional regulator [Chitinophagales bacterium]|nr:MarR family transcriptional regulator [Chitinophagales bacterium]MCB9075467.1 MarR family transcriptional regulator [Chitinophagales bacterium]HMU97772.1 MarR family transcriptional regulator [Chitinophagales bacterium]HMV02786.1 MarR family transcriptional regulator [Chitinophagales bacterium]HMW93282.1 MarR family transcriptional regulator [Chitinophagales bacterium]
MEDLFKEAADKMVIYNVRKSWLIIAKLYNEMTAKFGGTISMAFVLLALYEEEGVPVTKIAPRIGMEPNSLSRILKELESKGILERRKNHSDSRIVNIVLTEQGKKLRKYALKSVFNLEKNVKEDISENDLIGFFNVLEKIPSAINKIQEKVNQQRNK